VRIGVPPEGGLLLLFAAIIAAPAQAAPSDKLVAWAGAQLPDADGLYQRWDPKRSWATSYVIETLEVVAERVAFELPLADPLLIGDMSRRGGGRLDGHISHDKGIDVDIGLFMDDGRQPLGGFVDLRPSQLDVKSTWILVRTMLDTGQVQFILLDQGLIDRLKSYAINEVGLDRAEAEAIFPPRESKPAWSEKGVVRHAPNHKSHLHVRLLPPDGVIVRPADYEAAAAGPSETPTEPDSY
jgi:hypothetical protein